MAISLNEVVLQLEKYLPRDLETPYSQYATVNFVPGLQDREFIEAIVSERQSQLAHLTCEMERVQCAFTKLEAILAKLQETKSRVRQSMVSHHALTSPARRVPPEVLGQIFYHCLPKSPYITPRNVECPMVLTQVCRHWRAVAMATPRLWSSLTIHLHRATRDDCRPEYDAWLARAKSVPLAIRVLNDMDTSDPDLTRRLSSVADWLRPLVARSWDLWWHGPSLQNLFVSGGGGAIGSLERLRVTSHRESPSIYIPTAANRLRSAYLQCLNFDLQSLDTVILPWEQLTELNMHFALFSSSVFLRLLALCTGIRNMILSCLCADEEQLNDLRTVVPGSIVNYAIKRIEIKMIRAGLGFVLDALLLPALEELEICFCYHDKDVWPHAQFLSFLQRSRCPLKKLTVRNNKHAVSCFAEYREALPSLCISTASQV
ncbi:hypothetical protein F5I97DRAFT_1829519 [Phlebopus sp. FC_14]|nr:hypothetical protein F5I97DRAFT_1829519 [Phlebopus sp. FC_14]